MIDCGEPDVPEESYVTGYDFHVHSDVEYHCNVGHQLVGEPVRRCQRDGTWSGNVPLCKCESGGGEDVGGTPNGVE